LRAFSTVKPADKVVFTKTTNATGDHVIVGVEAVTDGSLSDLGEAEKRAIETQLTRETSTLQLSAYFKALEDSAEIEIY